MGAGIAGLGPAQIFDDRVVTIDRIFVGERTVRCFAEEGGQLLGDVRAIADGAHGRYLRLDREDDQLAKDEAPKRRPFGANP